MGGHFTALFHLWFEEFRLSIHVANCRPYWTTMPVLEGNYYPVMIASSAFLLVSNDFFAGGRDQCNELLLSSA